MASQYTHARGAEENGAPRCCGTSERQLRKLQQMKNESDLPTLYS